jgi:hypothetical protein
MVSLGLASLFSNMNKDFNPYASLEKEIVRF